MHETIVKEAAARFIHSDHFTVEPLGSGLIHQTYKVSGKTPAKMIVLQAINTSVFGQPEDIVHNYGIVYEWLLHSKTTIRIPAPVPDPDGRRLWKDPQSNFWRATIFMEHSYSQLTAQTEEAAHTVAKSFGAFTRALTGLEMSQLRPVIPDFHNLAFRSRQLEESVEEAPVDRLMRATHIIAALRERSKLLDFFLSVQRNPYFPERVLHHDCKISNILFEHPSGRVICPVDLDTVMPGLFFSDLGDMIRTMTCPVDEDSTQWEDIRIQSTFYRAIVSGYLEGIGNILTAAERLQLHISGLIMIYMQAIRFLEDFLHGDVYYKISHPDQNLHRALNQLILLEKLEEFLLAEYRYRPE